MKPLRIFVVDDDRDAAEGLAEVLEMFGHKVQLAFNGEEAVRIFQEQDFDVSLMDIMMPGMNGVESFMEIRKIKPNAKVFMMTGYSVQQLMRQAIENGALGVLNKPVDMESLIKSLEDIKPEGMVLLADDDPNFCQGMSEVLKQHGYNVCVANTGQDALDRLASDAIDVLVLDLRLPVVSGLEVYMNLKKKGLAVPTIVVTGHEHEETEAIGTFRDLCSTGVLVKPFDPSQLVKALETISQKDSAPAASAPAAAPPASEPLAAPSPREPLPAAPASEAPPAAPMPGEAVMAPAAPPPAAPAAPAQPVEIAAQAPAEAAEEAKVRPVVQKVTYAVHGPSATGEKVSYSVDQTPSRAADPAAKEGEVDPMPEPLVQRR